MKNEPGENSRMFKQVICGTLIVLVTGWITYVSAKGIGLDTLISGINTRVTVLETVAATIKNDILEMKGMLRDIRNDQMRKQRRDQ